jgi:hypothetical protein
MNLTKGEKENEEYWDWAISRDIQDNQHSIAFNLWQINKTLERLIKATKEKA